MALTYYLTIDGINGGSTNPAHQGAFEISDYSFDVSTLINTVGGQSVPDKATFAPLSIDLDLNSGLTSLLTDLTNGQRIKSLRLEGVVNLGGTQSTVYDLKLGGVVITKYHDTNTGHDNLLFQYNQVILTTTPQNPGGTLGAPVTTSWDILKGTANATVPNPVAGLGNSNSVSIQKYYLTINGINGGSASQSHPGAFEISGYSFDSSILTTLAAGGGLNTSKPSFSPLSINLDLSSGQTQLLSDLASGQIIPSIRLEGVVTDPGGTESTVYDLKLGNVALTQYHETSTGQDTLNFTYSKVALTTTPQNADGSLGKSVTSSWDVTTNRANATIANPVAGAGDSSIPTKKDYYLTIDGLNGGSLSKNHQGTFEVSGFSFDASLLANLSLSSNGLRTGSPDFSPLSIDLLLGPDQTTLFRDFTTSQKIQSIRLQGTVTSPTGLTEHTVYDLKLGDVFITQYHDTNTGLDSLRFIYGKFVLTTTPEHADGTFGTPVTSGWNLETKQAITSANATTIIPNPVIGTAASTGQTTAVNPGGEPKYYLTINGVNGGSSSQSHKGAFEINKYSFDGSSLTTLSAGSKFSISNPTFSPLTIDLDLNSGQTQLLSNLDIGKVIPSIRLEGVITAPGGTEQTFYDLKLGDVVITQYHDTNTGHDTLSFNYSRVILATASQNANGTFGKPVSVGWDIQKGQAITSGNLTSAIPNPVAGLGNSNSANIQKYYLTINGINGGSASQSHTGAFEISGYSFDSSISTTLGPSSGLSTSKPSFSPLTINLNLNSGQTQLLSDLASGQIIPSIRLEGVVTNLGGTESTVYDLKLGNVALTQYHETSTGQDTLTFTYSKVILTTTPQNADGSLGKSVTSSWDVAANRANTTIANPVAGLGSPTIDVTPTYYLTIDGLNGGSLSQAHRGAFEVNGFSFDTSTLTTQTGGGGSSSAKPTFAPLSVDLDLSAGQTELLSDIASGHLIKSIRLEGAVHNASGRETNVYDLKLGNVYITQYHDTNTGHDNLMFNYSQVVLTTTPEIANGTFGNSTTTSWNIAKGQAGASVSNPVPSNSPPIVSAAIISNKTEDDITYSINLLTGASDAENNPLTAGVVSLSAVDNKNNVVNVSGVTQFNNNLNVDPNAYNFLEAGQSVSITGRYNISDGQGGSVPQTVSVNIAGVNDSATISGISTGTVTEDASTPTLTTTGNLTVSDVDTGENKFNTTVTSAPGDLGSLSITDTGAWTYSVGNNLVQSLGAGQTKTESFTVTSLDGTATQDINVSINGVNDSATISGISTGTVTEDASTPTLTTTGNLTVSDVDTGENKFNTTVTSAPGDLGSLSITDTGTWTYSVDNNLVQSLSAGQTKTESFTVKSLDGTASQDINVSIHGVNDSATISGISTGTVTEDVSTPTLTTTGNLTVSDVDTGENKFNTTVTSAPGDLGSLSITDTGTWTYSVGNNLVQSLGAGQTKTESFTVTSLDGTVSQDINVSINGVNDSATISGTATGTVTEDNNVVNGTLQTTGNLTVSDVDTGENKFNTTVTSAPGDLGTLSITDTGTWTYSVGNNLVQSLGAGQTKTESFTVTSLDGTATQDINVSINGVNDSATISGTATGAVTEDASTPTLTTTGNLTVSDIDTGENKFNTTVTPALGDLGSLSITDTGTWTYSVDNNLVQSLGAGQTKTESFTVKSLDGTASQVINVSINGVNDSATISGTATGTVTEDATTPNLTTTGNLTVSDVDTGENKFNTTVTSAPGDLGSLSITDTGAWTYSVGNNLVQSLGAGQTKTESFTVTSLDGTATQDINVSINGVNDSATISGTATGTVTEDATTPNLTTTGNLTVSDVDTGENKFNTTITSAPGDLGSLSITDTGTWTYSVDNNLVQSLGAGQTKTESFTVTSLDGTATQDINVSINGVNDAPVTDPDKLLTLSENAAPTSLNIASPTDIEGDPLSLQVTALPDPSKGQILLNDGTPLTPSQSLSLAELTGLVFSPIPNANGNAGSFSYTVSDGQGGFASQSITLNITPDNTGQSLGDPHIITFDQFHYNFQATGDFILTRSLDTDLEVQVRQAPWVLNPSTTLNVALATMVDGNKVEFYIDQPYPIVDGIALTIQPGQTQALGQGSISRTDTSGYGRLGDLYTIVYPNGDVLANQVFSGFLMDPSLTLSDSPSVVGLLGNNNGNPNDDLALQDGTPLSNPLDPTILEGVFATSWRVSDTQSLFTPASELAPLKLNLAQSGSTALSNNLPSLPERFVFGGNGNDTLIGVQNPLVNPGNGEVDVLTGNQGADTFVLGDANHPYYVGYGQQDFALISDFSSGDSIQLHGNAHDYILGTASVDTVKGTGVFLASDPNELLGLIRGNAVSNLNLNNTSIFHFV